MKVPFDLAELPSPELSSTMCARMLATHRELTTWVAGYGDLVSDTLLEPVCLMHVFAAPWHTAEQLRLHNRMAAWLFALDNAVEGAATLADVEEIADRCRQVAAGAEPADPFYRCLRDVLAELRAVPLWPTLADQWSNLFEATLDAVCTERRNRVAVDAGGTPPSIEDYIANCDNAEVRIAYFTYWMATAGDDLPDHLDVLMPALWEAQVAVRWANDFRSVMRGDAEATVLNSAALGIGPDEIHRRALEAADRCGELLAPLIARSVPEAVALDRTTRSVVAFYGISDYRPEGRGVVTANG
ncbi:MAG TPA: terpene synthase family protein [Actinophytocola sp.]|nr:terpene synthase family protein [Actinophytocola sp.]